MGKRGQSSIFKFFIEAFIGGVKNNLKFFIGACGFVAALGAVFAGSGGMSQKSAPASDLSEIGISDQAGGGSRSPASVPNDNGLVQTKSGLPGSNPFRNANSDSNFIHGASESGTASNNGGASASDPGGRGPAAQANASRNANSGYVPPVYPDSAKAESKKSDTPVDGNTLGAGGSANPFSSPSPDTSTSGSNSWSTATVTSAASNLGSIAGFSVSSGGGLSITPAMRVQASAGEVVSSNYTKTPGFIVISGVAGTFFSN